MVKIVHISDTHLKEFNPEPGDILIHSGDALNYGNELVAFREQLIPIHQNYKHIIFVPGNHDRLFESDFLYCRGFLKELIPNIHILHNEGIELEGFKIYGTADQPQFYNWAFNRDPHELYTSYANIPDDTEILITHCPAKGMRDMVYGKSVGSPELAYNIPRFKNLKLHAFGHIHSSQGLTNIDGICYSNGSMVDERYQPGYKENIVELP